MKSTPAFWTGIYILGFIAAQVSSSICFRFVAERSGSPAVWLFVAGNLIGFFCTVFLTLALKGQHPNIIYALCTGGGFCVLQLASFLIFRMPLSSYQWAGIALIVCGMIVLQLKV